MNATYPCASREVFSRLGQAVDRTLQWSKAAGTMLATSVSHDSLRGLELTMVCSDDGMIAIAADVALDAGAATHTFNFVFVR